MGGVDVASVSGMKKGCGCIGADGMTGTAGTPEAMQWINSN